MFGFLIVRFARLRQVDVKAEHFERQVQRVEQERDLWEKKYEVREILYYH
jgi:tropomyosin